MLGMREPQLDPLDDSLQTWAKSITSSVSPDRLRADVMTLPAPRNRLNAPEAMERADEMILQGFREAGWMVDYRFYEWTNAVGFLDHEKGKFAAGTKLAIYRELAGANLLAIKEGSTSRDAILVGAHHDTLRDSPGADDNTASVAALLELSRVLAPHSFRDTILLAAFDMEEIGFFGSKALVEELTQERTIKSAIIYETMAYSDSAPDTQSVPKVLGSFYPKQIARIRERKFAGDWTLIVYRNFATEVAQAFGSSLAHIAGPHVPILMRDPVDLPVFGKALSYVLPVVNNFGRSDNRIFWDARIPAIMITDIANFRNPNYHQPTDTPETLDYDRLAEIVAATAVSLAQLAGLVPTGQADNSIQSSRKRAMVEYALNHIPE
jgi:Peptidase family M28